VVKGYGAGELVVGADRVGFVLQQMKLGLPKGIDSNFVFGLSVNP
jgi:hypothetical protein